MSVVFQQDPDGNVWAVQDLSGTRLTHLLTLTFAVFVAERKCVSPA